MHVKMSSSLIARYLASLYRRQLRRTVRLGCHGQLPAAEVRLPALCRRSSSFLGAGRAKMEHMEAGAGNGADGGATRPPPCRDVQERKSLFTWTRFVIGSVVAAVSPFLHSRWMTFLRIQSELEMVKDAAEVVEEVAAVAEKVSAEVAEQLPDDGKMRRAAVAVEHASKEVAEEAHLAQDIIHKVEEIEGDVKAIIQPIVDHSKHGDAKAQHKNSSNH